MGELWRGGDGVGKGHQGTVEPRYEMQSYFNGIIPLGRWSRVEE